MMLWIICRWNPPPRFSLLACWVKYIGISVGGEEEVLREGSTIHDADYRWY